MSQPVEDNNAPSALNPQPSLREDQISSAIQFLLHPKVIGSPIGTKRSFLERKGLTNEEIDEAFRRLPAQPTDIVPSASAIPVSSNQGTGLVTYTPQPIQRTNMPAQQPTSVVPMQQSVTTPRQEPVRWTQVTSEASFTCAPRAPLKFTSLHGLFLLICSSMPF